VTAPAVAEPASVAAPAVSNGQDADSESDSDTASASSDVEMLEHVLGKDVLPGTIEPAETKAGDVECSGAAAGDESPVALVEHDGYASPDE